MNNSKLTPQSHNQPRQPSLHSPKIELLPRIEHQFFSRMPDINSVESDLMKLLNEFSDTRLKKYGTNEIHEKLFKKMDSIRDKQERIAKNHFEQDERLSESKIEGEDQKAQSMRDLEELTRQLEELNNSIHELHEFHFN
ncbi:unnamed protein product [Brachionus calyciflorus]|uniref:Uncharacterized protein n=1 Tax=Brachionus calyciflorus TaxID=104777 RepID=A0A813M241_9BILA|nr:unnamed protein product [Brachionus calyciflorus]